MKIEGKIPTEGPEGRRFQASKSAPLSGGKSFGAELKKAAAFGKAPAEPAPVNTQTAAETPVPEDPPGIESVAHLKTKASKGKTAEESATFENHMELVKLRLQSGYYTSKTVDDALSDRLTGYFDELA
ncbi:MAG: hypothetical protein M3Y08_10600 [Fibrobacterota bacterium]|nr:hypothetical protein [Fibrobacterota bacterium]